MDWSRAVSLRCKRQCDPRHRREQILILNQPFWLLDSASIQRIAGEKQATAAHALISDPDGTF
jgi:hypothetical protein